VPTWPAFKSFRLKKLGLFGELSRFDSVIEAICAFNEKAEQIKQDKTNSKAD
jgi:hypothetical protein